jgi:hypothetical protein
MLRWCLINGCPISGTNDDELELYPEEFNLLEYAFERKDSDICKFVRLL